MVLTTLGLSLILFHSVFEAKAFLVLILPLVATLFKS